MGNHRKQIVVLTEQGCASADRADETSRPIIAVQSASLSLIDCVVMSIDSTKTESSLLSFHTSLISMTESVCLSVSRLVAQNLLLNQPLVFIRSTAELPPLMDSLSTSHSNMLTQTGRSRLRSGKVYTQI
ncbi:hypothetical protein BLNAU_1924 [Blattamonas nauphoetae]|uniref:Uncharacterized protein n=1 Tax=Blattamonas nauphoetae TaxID=2049346 RepID=A0ABQ9YGW5_9EUKA|nr:hypothetical protein BLNAU_1924 [Blattamonas nauphoetae]